MTQFTIESTCLLYTSDAADEEDSVDLGAYRTPDLARLMSLSKLLIYIIF